MGGRHREDDDGHRDRRSRSVPRGIFKGSFKVYALEGSGKKTKLKTYTVNVNGFVLDGVGYGTATCKKPAVSWTVTVE